MSMLLEAGCRLFQQTLKISSNLLPWHEPRVVQGHNSIMLLPGLLKEQNIRRVLVVTDPGIVALGLPVPLLNALQKTGILVAVYSKTRPNPTIENIEEALVLYTAGQCEAIIAFGGGSSIDCAKVVGARAARPHLSVQQMKGLFKVMHRLPPLYAVPTTAGTGSEATVAAVVVNESTHEKYPVNDLSLIPKVAVLDTALTEGLPPFLTATTGMDALTHAVEAYIGRSNTSKTAHYARSATIRIFKYLYPAFENGQNHTARKQMQLAAYMAGVAFTRAYVGNVHAIAHTLGGYYNTPHGLANAVILPYMLNYYGASVHKPLAELAQLVNPNLLGQTEPQKARWFIEAIRRLNRSMGIPEKIEGIRQEDIPFMVDNAFREANPLYPVPMVFDKQDFYAIYSMISA